MPYKTTVLCLLLAGCFFVTACNSSGSGNCSKKIDCPAFSDTTLTNWFPYADNQQLIFTSNTNLHDTFTLKNTEVSKPYSVTTGGFGGGAGGCDTHKNFQSLEIDTTNRMKLYVQLSTITPAFSTTTTKYVNMQLYGNDIYGTDLKSNGFTQIMINSKYGTVQSFASLAIGSKTYSNVQSAGIDTTGDKGIGIYQVYFARGYGLVGYQDHTAFWTKR